MEEAQTLAGVIERFLFQSADNNFVIFVLTAGKDATIVKGNLPALQAGQEVQLTGHWGFHKKFGKQFEAITCISKLPTTVVGLKKYLGSGLIKGIGKVYADKLVNYFGIEILKIIDSEPQRLKEVGGIGDKRIEMIAKAWHDQKGIADVMIFLQEKDISPAYAAKIYKQYKHESIAILHENPYRLADEIWGIGFKMADEIAQKMGFQLYAPQRIAAGIIFALSSAANQGHLYVELDDLRKKSLELLQLDESHAQHLKSALHDLYNRDKIKLITHENKHYIGTTSHYLAEFGVAQRIKTLQKRTSTLTFDIKTIYDQLRAPRADDPLVLNDDQQMGIMTCLQHKITIITGGPGTGKTTLIKKLLATLEHSQVRYKLAAPTGRAAQRITEGTGRYASTIHRLLDFDVSIMRFTHNESNTLQLDFLIIDEASMIDIFLANAILKALPLNAHLILIGDIDQLPSVGAGNFLNDCIASKLVPCIKLTQIFRQARDSLIIVNAHRVNHGEFPVSVLPDARRDFLFIKEEKPEVTIDHIKRVLFIELKKHGIPLDDVQILVPMNRGTVGTHTLNHQLQELLNPGDKEKVMHAGTFYKVGDKVMQIRNNYDKKIFNGDIGTISTIDQEDKNLVVSFGNRPIEYDFDELSELVLAYAVTIHKSQGSEYAAAIIPIFTQHFTLLQRNLIYTAITRAKKLCILIGQPRAIAMAIKNNSGIKRVTFLQKFLIENS